MDTTGDSIDSRTASKDLPIATALIKAADLLARPNAWTRSVFARDAEGKPLSFGHSSLACQWCVLGALESVTFNYPLIRNGACKVLGGVLGIEPFQDDIADWNDNSTQTEVVAKLREAAALAAAEGR